jgi:UPF0716 protein FxsA
MRMLWVLLLWPLVEIGLFVTLGGRLGLLASLGIVLGTAVLGILILHRGGAALLAQARRGRLERGAGNALVTGVLRAVAAVLLILPGFFTDFIGLMLLLPPVQWAISAYAANWVMARTVSAATARRGSATYVEGEFTELPPQAPTGSGWTRD